MLSIVSGMTVDGTVVASKAAGVASDQAGNPNEASASTDNIVTYTAPALVSISSITYATKGGKNGDKHLLVTLALVDAQNNPISGAVVSLECGVEPPINLGRAPPDRGGGNVTFKLNNAKTGCHSTTVTGVAIPGLTWNGVTPANGFCK